MALPEPALVGTKKIINSLANGKPHACLASSALPPLKLSLPGRHHGCFPTHKVWGINLLSLSLSLSLSLLLACVSDPMRER